jgi:hypothetical protein
LDEAFVKSLAFMLTDEMEGRADDYRQTDDHPIAAMHSEPYEVSSAASLPERMREYYVFLQTTSIHPLIKAAVGQAFLLAARPFPEGNERLSRMISSAVLLRSGYDFFRDISISSLIARENFRYYKAMCEILRPENGSDLTYFIEYYLDLLARALEAKKDRDKRREDEQNKEALERERQMAHQPLGATPSALPPRMALPEERSETQAVEPQETEATDSPPIQGHYATESQVRIHKLLVSSRALTTDRQMRVERTLASFIDQGIYAFSREQWQAATGIERGAAQDDCGYMTHKGLVSSEKIGIYSTYTLTAKTKSCSQETISIGSFSPMRQSLRELLKTGTDPEKRIAAQVMELLDQGITHFTRAEWIVRTGLSKSVGNDDLRTAVNHSLIEQTDDGYRICERVDQEKRFRTPTPMIRDAVSRLLGCFADRPFSTTEAANLMSVRPNTAAYCLEQLTQKGIVTQERVGQRPYQYTFTKEYLVRRQITSVPVRSEVSTSMGNYAGVAAAARSLPPMQL